INYYRVTFDYLIPANNLILEVLAISIIKVDNNRGTFTNKHLLFSVDPTEYTGKKVLTILRYY
ncbi:hypothetical protein K432DRAFT_304084, partial [Lepidopterella palustris CBS 459.81]